MSRRRCEDALAKALNREIFTMTKTDTLTLRGTAAVLALLLFQAPAASAAGMMDGRGMGMMGGSARHVYYMRHGLPPEYAEFTNPLARSSENIAEGQALYRQFCASCHGAEARGDGEAGRNLTPPPSDLTSVVQMPMTNEGYLYWTIAEGGAQFNSAMPVNKKVLKDIDIWKLVLYLQSL